MRATGHASANSANQGGLQGIVNHADFALCCVVQSFHQALLGFFPVAQLRLSQGHIVENLPTHEEHLNLLIFESFMQMTEFH